MKRRENDILQIIIILIYTAITASESEVVEAKKTSIKIDNKPAYCHSTVLPLMYADIKRS